MGEDTYPLQNHNSTHQGTLKEYDSTTMPTSIRYSNPSIDYRNTTISNNHKIYCFLFDNNFHQPYTHNNRYKYSIHHQPSIKSEIHLAHFHCATPVY